MVRKWSDGWPRAKYEWVQEDTVDGVTRLMEAFGLREVVSPEHRPADDCVLEYDGRLWTEGAAPEGTAKELRSRLAVARVASGTLLSADFRARFLPNSVDGRLDQEAGNGADDDD